MYVNTSQNKSQGIVVSFYHARNSYRKIGSNAFEKKEEIVAIFVCNGKAEEAEKIV